MKVNNSCRWKIVSNVIIACHFFIITGCTSIQSAMIGGGDVVKSDSISDKILVTYKPVVVDEKETTHQLIETSEGLAFSETTQGKKVSLISSIHWEDAENDYFGSYFGNKKDAWRFVVPKDRTKDAKRYYYGNRWPKYINGGFKIITVDGVKQIAEKDPSAAVPIILSPM